MQRIFYYLSMSLIQKLTHRMTYQWGPSPDLGWSRSAPWDQKKMVMICVPNMVKFMTTWRDCEMKISPAISVNKKCHSHQWFLASKCNWGISKLTSRVCCHPPRWLLRSWGSTRSSHLPLLKVNKETGLFQVAEVLMKGTSPASPETCIFPNREC